MQLISCPRTGALGPSLDLGSVWLGVVAATLWSARALYGVLTAARMCGIATPRSRPTGAKSCSNAVDRRTARAHFQPNVELWPEHRPLERPHRRSDRPRDAADPVEGTQDGEFDSAPRPARWPEEPLAATEA